ncbi:MerR family transcriptional regulator [Plantactinospora sp. KLBMP9567]|uniref:MerR family transcriptional regulator n=1 Tax=Plantactinospora sp. KLBMP9567 TaxID=3085900 RepID=UPI0029814BC1|nr:MerR family transcriptional regulator [Plantactinospora sp. KLBMP9567]MDW5323651.1 MerR family transcriptional regulator [Plantactinospora sp. KLBMP9567]
MRIGELAAKTGVSVRALCYYEEQHLLPATRTGGGQRHYPEQAVDRVHLIQTLYAAGLSSKTILDLLPCVDAKVNTPESRAVLRAERDRIERRVAELVAARDRLDAVIASSEDPASGCALIDPDDRRAGDRVRDRSASGAVIR